MPNYAGGLGILAGDYILEADKEDYPIVGFGLYYQKGQNSRTRTGEPNGRRFGLKLLKNSFFGKRILLSIPIEDRDILAQVWCWHGKNNSVYFLDTNIPENSELDRLITEQLYVEDRELRLKQELVLGIGGVRLLNRLGIIPSVFHLNEGHSAFLIIELLGKEINKGLKFVEVFDQVKKKVVFTNHTLVLEGQEMFAFDSLVRNTTKLCTELNLDIQEILEKGKNKPEDKLFSLTTFALNGSVITNAVSRIHGEKARELWPGYRIIHITNGIFIPRWDKIKTGDIVKKHQKNEDKLLKLIRAARGDNWKKEALLIGWSRRFVPYKRPLALLEDVTKLKEILEYFKGQVHIVYSAPLDVTETEKNAFLKKLSELMVGELKGYVTFIPHYKLDIAEIMVAGCDIWLNTPIVGQEACGTSGMKAALNGTLALSTNDGWINEVPLADFGWLIDDQDITKDLLEKLQKEIVPEFEKFIKTKDGSNWQEYMKKSRQLILKNFSTTRMLKEYIEKLYSEAISK